MTSLSFFSCQDTRLRQQMYADLQTSFTATLQALRDLIDQPNRKFYIQDRLFSMTDSDAIELTKKTNDDLIERELLLIGPLHSFGLINLRNRSNTRFHRTRQYNRLDQKFQERLDNFRSARSLLLTRLGFIGDLERSIYQRPKLSKWFDDMRVLLANNLHFHSADQLRDELKSNRDDFLGILSIATGFSSAVTLVALSIS